MSTSAEDLDAAALRLPLRRAQQQVTLATLALNSNGVERIRAHLADAQRALLVIEQSLSGRSE